MADFDAILKEVKDLEARHTSLLVLIPQLEEQEKGLKEAITAAQHKLMEAEEELDETRNAITRAQATFEEQVAKDKSALESARATFESYKARETAKIDGQVKLIKVAQDELAENKSELDTLLQEQVELNKSLKEDVASCQEKLEALDAEKTFLDGQKKLLDVDIKKLREHETAVANVEASLADDKQKTADILKDAEAKQSKADKALAEAKEHKNLVSLKIDEYQRKEALLKEQAIKLRKREIAISDKEAVYSSYK